MSESNPYEAPSAPLLENDADEPLPHAGRMLRLAATLLDWVMLWAAFGIPVLAITLASSRFSHGSTGDSWGIVAMPAGLAALAAVAGWNAFGLHRRGQTLGKRLCRIRLLRSDGSPIPLWRILLTRWLPFSFWFAIPMLGPVILWPFLRLVDVLFIFGPRRRCLHDYLADTIVVKA